MSRADRAAGVPARAGTVLEIDLAAIAGNWRRLQAELQPPARAAAVVKADAYGLGQAEVAPALFAAGCRLFFVATLDEGVALRRLLPKAEIAVFNGLLPETGGEFRQSRLLPVLNDLGQIAEWRGDAATRRLPAIVHVDTGMARLGLPREEVARLAAAPDLLDGIPLAAVMSHLACADAPEHPQNAEQLGNFRRALALLPRAPASLAASSGIFLGRDYHLDLARPGAALYGVNPIPGRANPMAQVVRLKARILQLRDVDRGTPVGYGAAQRMERSGRLATIAIGYADGWLRSSSHRGSVSIAGQQAAVIGRISMDLLTVDVTGIDPALAQPGGFVDLIDEHHDVDAVAAAAGTIGYEILTALGRRHHRVYRGGAG